MKIVVRFKSRKTSEYTIDDPRLFENLIHSGYRILIFDDVDEVGHVINFNEVEEIDCFR